MDQEPPVTPKTREQEPILTFEEFSLCNPYARYNNFFLYFSGWEVYMEKEYYKRFVFEHPDMAAELCDKIQNRKQSYSTKESLKPFTKNLYEAYKIMRSYGVSDKDLFA